MAETSTDPPKRVAIAVLTYHREHLLAALLPMLAGQLADLERRIPGRFEGRVVVVDNDPDASARDVVARSGLDSVAYVVEPTPGISAGRNRALDETEDADLLVFIDDDESPRPGWLVELVRTQERHGAGAVAGPVVSVPECDPDPFVAAGDFFARRHREGLATGSPLERAATNNLLLDLRRVRSLGLRFDQRFGTTGGEDSVFTGRLHAAGVPMVWCAEAVVTDHVPADRLTKEYVLRRTAALSSSGVSAELALRRSRRSRVLYRAGVAVRELARFAGGTALVLRGRATRALAVEARGHREVARGRGAFLALRGRRPQTYARPPV